ncbi:hypothetical protein SGPA1_21432 [Streptomyces misionensis JCM 4497]
MTRAFLPEAFGPFRVRYRATGIQCEERIFGHYDVTAKTTIRPARHATAGRGRRCQGPLPGLR